MLSYTEAQSMMQKARHGRRKLENNTWLEERPYVNGGSSTSCEPPDYAVRLHSTDVVTIHPDGSYTLNSGGWRTVTTKDRINRYSGIPLSQVRGTWFVYPKRKVDGGIDWDVKIPFEDGMRINSKGERVNL